MTDHVISKRQRSALELRGAMGALHVLAVGVSNYDAVPDFSSIRTGESDAHSVADCFRDVHQLNADKTQVKALPSGKLRPTRGTILGALRRLSDSSTERLLFYFSGHGVRLNVGGRDVLHLVPEDAFSADDATSLVSYEQIIQILNESSARLKLVILDACFSGPDTSDLKVRARGFSHDALLEYVRNTEGIAVLASSPSTAQSSALSPNPTLSLMTHFLVEALRGDPAALDENGHLTVSSLFDHVAVNVQRTAKSHHREQKPVLELRATGDILLGDFSHSIVDPDSFDLGAFPVKELEFVARQKADLTKILTRLQNWHYYSPERLQDIANQALPEHIKEGLGKRVAALRAAMRFPVGTVAAEGAGIDFPNGSYSVEYEHDDRTRGALVYRVRLEREWLARAQYIPDLLDSLDLSPSEIRLHLSGRVRPETAIAGLQAKGWTVTSELRDRVQAENEVRTRISIEPATIVLSGLAPSEIFGDRSAAGQALQLAATFSRVFTR